MQPLATSVSVRGTTMPAFLWRASEGGRNGAGILLLMEAYGITDHIKEVGARLAQYGYDVLAPCLYHRTQPAGKTFEYEDRTDAMAAMDAVDVDLAVDDAIAAIDALLRMDGIQRVGAVGLCFGGSLVLPLVSACGKTLGAGVSFYGHCNGTWLSTADAHIEAPLLFFYGENDAVFPRQDVDRLGARLTELQKVHTIRRFAGVGHGYFNPRRREYAAEAASATWSELIAFLEQHLAKPAAMGPKQRVDLAVA